MKKDSVSCSPLGEWPPITSEWSVLGRTVEHGALVSRLRDLSGSKFSEELKGLLGRGVKGECSEKVFYFLLYDAG